MSKPDYHLPERSGPMNHSRLGWFWKTVKSYPFFSGFLLLILLLKIWYAGIVVHAVPAGYYRRYEFISQEVLMVVLWAAILSGIVYLVSKYDFLRWNVTATVLITVFFFLISPRTLPFVHKRQCQANLRKIADSCVAYAADHQGYYPPSLEKLVELKYLDMETLHCPANRWHNPGDIDYRYYGAGVRRDLQNDKDVLLKEKEKYHQMVSKDFITFEGSLVRIVIGSQDDWGSNEDKRYFKDGKIVKTW